MTEEPVDAVVESSPTDAPAPSAAQPQEITPEPVKEFNMPPAERWEELRQQRVQAEERASKAEQLAQLALQKLQNPQAAPDVDPYAGMDASTAEFYRNIDHRIEQKALALANQQIQPVLQIADAFRRELAEIKVERFQDKNQDIKPGSEAYNHIAVLVNQGFDLQTATEKVMYKRLKEENQMLKAKQQSVGSKVSANATGPTTSIPAGAGLPGKPGDWRETVREASRKGGSLADILNAAGATRES